MPNRITMVPNIANAHSSASALGASSAPAEANPAATAGRTAIGAARREANRMRCNRLVLSLFIMVAQYRCAVSEPAPLTPSILFVSESERFSAQAISAMQQGEPETARKLLIKAIYSNPDDIGRSFNPSVNLECPPSPWGSQQVRQLLVDRPAMRAADETNNPLHRYATCLFGGSSKDRRIIWDSSQPIADADHIPATLTSLGRVRTSETFTEGWQKGRKRTYEEMWSSIIFELHNVANSKATQQIVDAGKQGRIGEIDYVKGMFNLELVAVQKTRAFYVYVYLPWATENNTPSNPRLWYAESWWGTSRDLFARWEDHTSYPWNPYETYYRNHAKAFLEELLSEGDPSFSKDVIIALKNFSYVDKSCVGLLVGALSDRSIDLRTCAANAIRQLDLETTVINEHLLPSLKAKPTLKVVMAIHSLGGCSPDLRRELINKFDASSDDAIKVAILKTLSDFGQSRAWVTSRLLELTSTPDRKTRIDAIEALGTLGTGAIEAVPRLAELTNNSDEEVSSASVDSLISINRAMHRAVDDRSNMEVR